MTMDDDRRKLLLIIGGVMIGLLVFTSVLLSFRSEHKTDSPETEGRPEPVRTEDQPVSESGEEEFPDIDEDLLYEAEEFMDLLMQEAPEQIPDVQDSDERKGQAERDAIAAALSVWDYRKDQIRDDATRQKLTLAEEKADSLEDSYIKTRLLELLRKAEEEFELRQARDWTVNPDEETEGTEPSSESQADIPITSTHPESLENVPSQSASSPDRNRIETNPSAEGGTAETDRRPPSVVPDSTMGDDSGISKDWSSATGESGAGNTIPEIVLYPHVSNHNRVSMEEIDNRYPYDILTPDEKDVINSLEDAFRNRENDELVLDDPGFSFMETMTILQAQNDIFFPYLPNSLSVNQADGKIVFAGMEDARVLYSKNMQLKEEAYRKGRELIRQGMTEKEAVIAINNYVCDCLCLDENAGLITGSDVLLSNAVEDGIASCRGYANLFKHMCNSVGIDCRLDFGTISDDPQGHVWDLVKVDDSWYYCDSVWNDGGSDEYPYMFSAGLWNDRVQKYPTWGFSEADVG